jgi:hypothetical protein
MKKSSVREVEGYHNYKEEYNNEMNEIKKKIETKN